LRAHTCELTLAESLNIPPEGMVHTAKPQYETEGSGSELKDPIPDAPKYVTPAGCCGECKERAPYSRNALVSG
jgi:hypothetical protein